MGLRKSEKKYSKTEKKNPKGNRASKENELKVFW